ncbi:NAD-dependent epimerase/dehydratase family protein [Streptomyces sp. CB02923]|uniref:NAD-dependent epimerase/dehydratase family protein n=1 Tax=Streptomyces sp. CB02923 TaxID=1718985 RepID=UPI0009A12D75|nr:NAD-dependent epimerase/dehydratase family protein [Streptomyces sp. CB02923]
MSAVTPPAPLHVVLGTGPAGTTLAEELLRQGLRVRTVDRTGRAKLPGVEAVAADLGSPAAAREAVAGAEVVHHCVNVAYEHQVEMMPALQKVIVDATAEAGARLVVMDTLYPYGPSGGEPLTEDAPWRATSRKGRMRARLDEAYLAAHRAGRLPVVLARAADFYGPRVVNSTLGGAVFPAALTGGTVIALGSLDLAHSFTYIGDVARGMARLSQEPDAFGRAWHLPTAAAPTVREVLDLVRDRTKITFETEVLTEPRSWGPFDDAFMAEYAELFYQHTETQTMVSDAFEQRFGTAPTPLRDGIGATVDWYWSWLAERSAERSAEQSAEGRAEGYAEGREEVCGEGSAAVNGAV